MIPYFIQIAFTLLIWNSSPRLNCNPDSLEIINTITGWLDSSNVYGSDEEEARELRYTYENSLTEKARIFFTSFNRAFEDGLLKVDSPTFGSFSHPCSKARQGLQDLPPPTSEFTCQGTEGKNHLWVMR